VTWLDWAKLIGPYLLELLKVILKGPHGIAVQNLREKGVLKDSDAR
jgi:hypothetical protein